MTTVHAYTNDQNLLDLPHKDLRRARAAAVNIVPASTGAARATSLVLESMKGRLDGLRAAGARCRTGRSPTSPRWSPGEPSVERGQRRLRRGRRHAGPLDRVLVYTEDPIVSSDIVGTPASCTFDAGLTMVMPISDEGHLVKVYGLVRQRVGLLQPAGRPRRDVGA